MVNVSLIKGNNRYKNVFRALKEIEPEIKQKIAGKKRIVLKPNFVSTTIQLAATHVEAVKAVLDFLKPLNEEKIIVAEGAASYKTEEGFKNFGYFDELKDYNIEFQDLNNDSFSEFDIYSEELKPMKIGIAKTILDSDFRISLALLKTHETVIVTLTLKNMIVGSLMKKSNIHQGYKATNLNLTKLAEIIPPQLSIIDGFLGMEGDGPVQGTPIEMNVALAGTDFLSVDTVGINLMGFDISQIGYLYWCKEKKLGIADLKQINILGNTSIEESKKKFQLSPNYNNSIKWQ